METNKFNTIEFFSGTRSFSKVAQTLGHTTKTIDIDKKHKPDLCKDILCIDPQIVPSYHILWASPPCESFSVAAMGKNWEKETRKPKTEKAKKGLDLVEHTIKIIAQSKPKFWFIENPRGMLRKLIDPIFKKYGLTDYIRHTVTYCQYGDSRMKPTDIWTNCTEWKSKPICKNGDTCHESASRGSKTGTQGLKNATLRGVIPEQLFIEIFESIVRRKK